MDEHDLQTLGDVRMGAHRAVPAPVRPVGDVLRRGRSIRRRRRAAGTVGITAAACLVVAAGAVMAGRDDRGAADLEAGEPPAEPLPDWPDPCDAERAQEAVPGTEVEGLRLVPAHLPDSVTIAGIYATSLDAYDCHEVDPALVAWTLDDDGAVAGALRVGGPYRAAPTADDLPAWRLERAEIRGRRGIHGTFASGPVSDLLFWTDAGGATWSVEGTGLEPEALRAVAEALELDPRPPHGERVATLPAEDLPAGFEVVWQPQGIPDVSTPTRLRWTVATSSAICEVRIERSGLDGPALSATVLPDVDPEGVFPMRILTVRGDEQATSFVGGDGTTVEWREAPGVIGAVSCGVGGDDEAAAIAESLEPVPADDPRIDTGTPQPPDL